MASGSGGQPSTQPLPSSPPKVRSLSLEDVGLDKVAMDPSVHPCQDFYAFACGGWLKTPQTTPKKRWWVRSFSEIRKRNEHALKEIVEEAAHQFREGTDTDDPAIQQVGAFYTACMDEAHLDEIRALPIRELWDETRQVVNAPSLAKVLAKVHRYQVWPFYELRAAQDFGDATRMIGVLDQAGLGLPDKTYYLPTAEKAKRVVREQYFRYIIKLMRLMGVPAPAARIAANDVLRIEMSLAKLSKGLEERRNPVGMYHNIGIHGVRRSAPKFSWLEYLDALGYPQLKEISVTAPLFLIGVNRVMAQAHPRALQNYLRWHIVRQYAHALSSDFVREHQSFQKHLGHEPEPRWKYCLRNTEMVLVEPLTRIYSKKYFSKEDKIEVLKIFNKIREAFVENLTGVEWMDQETKQRALDKLHNLSYLIGYPSEWKSYTATVTADHATNMLQWAYWETENDLDKVGHMVDRNEWEVYPTSVNVHYHYLKNQLLFSAGALQPPFYSRKSAIQVLMGAMGSVVGHELTRAFDQQGSQFDAHGNLIEWWSPASRKAYEERTTCVEEQFSLYEPIEGVALNGRLTLSENIAELGGLKLAYAAYRKMREGATDVVQAEGFTEDQQFFLANAQVWCVRAEEDELLRRIQVDPHADPRSRVNGALSNFLPFSEAFVCGESTPMRSSSMCEVW